MEMEVRQAFDVSGGDLALDLANTLSRRPTADPREDLREYADLVEWGLQAGSIAPAEAAALRARAARSPRAARAGLARARELREAIFAVFSAVAGNRALPAPALDRVNAALPAALARLRLDRTGALWTWADGGDFDRVLWPVVRAAALLLTGPDRQYVRECAARDCAWLFLDRSRNGTRRWCDMAVCGNREKARRFRGAVAGVTRRTARSPRRA
jgi:predicted RNA-binding Zn ribbon-like protein